MEIEDYIEYYMLISGLLVGDSDSEFESTCLWFEAEYGVW